MKMVISKYKDVGCAVCKRRRRGNFWKLFNEPLCNICFYWVTKELTKHNIEVVITNE